MALRRSLRAGWPFALLLVYLATFRRAAAGPSVAGATDDCESAPGADVARLERCLEVQADNVGVLTALGAAYGASGRADRAEAVYRRALTIDPHDATLHVRLGQLLLTRGDVRGARAEGRLALIWQPGGAAALRLAGDMPITTAADR